MALVGLLLVALGLRLLSRARRLASLPELSVGIWFVGMGLGLPIIHRASIPGGVSPEVGPALVGFGQALVAIAFSGLYVFIWRVFGPTSSWRRNLAVAGVASGVVTWIGAGVIESFAPQGGPATLAMATIRIAGVAWAFGETTRYAALMRRRTRIGLADPVVSNRFALWSLWTGTLLLGMAFTVGVRWIQIELQRGGLEIDVDLLVASTRGVFAVFGLIVSSAMWLAFFPPARYEAWLRAQTATP